MVCVPAVNVETARLAWSELLTDALPRRVAPSKKATDPVGVPETAVTVAVKVTCWPTVLGFGSAVSVVVVVVAEFTVCVNVPELGSKVVAPE
jgi:hypothetical protein